LKSVRVLLVEDDHQVATSLAENLRLYEHEVEHVSTGSDAMAHPQVDLALIDLGLPDLDGMEVCRRLRLISDVPIIVISARSTESDRVLALHMGADDYLVKPFGVRELIARMDAVTRRYLAGTSPPAAGAQPNEQASQVLRHGQLVLDLRQREVTAFGLPVLLTRKEFDLLRLLMADPGAVVKRGTIIDQVWDGHWFGSTRTVDAHISALRRKLHGAALIEAKRGVGFRLAGPRQPGQRAMADQLRRAGIS